MNIITKQKYFIILILCSLLLIIYIIKESKIDYMVSSTPVQNISNDTECNGENNQHYNVGFGIEHYYIGYISDTDPILITLSCDHTQFKITGFVNQIIKSSDLKEYNYGETIELADLIAGTAVVTLEDYNFDGYNDISSVAGNVSSVDTYVIFLYNPKTNKFDYSPALSKLKNISINKEEETIQQSYCYFVTEEQQTAENFMCEKAYYKWNGDVLEGV